MAPTTFAHGEHGDHDDRRAARGHQRILDRRYAAPIIDHGSYPISEFRATGTKPVFGYKIMSLYRFRGSGVTCGDTGTRESRYQTVAKGEVQAPHANLQQTRCPRRNPMGSMTAIARRPGRSVRPLALTGP